MSIDVVTLGCRLNIHESQAIRDNAVRAALATGTRVTANLGFASAPAPGRP